MCRLCLKLKSWCIDDEGDFDPEIMMTFFRTDLEKEVEVPPYPMGIPMYNVLFGFYQGYFKYSGRNAGVERFHSALVNGKLHEFLMDYYKGKSSGYLTAVKGNRVDFNQVSDGTRAREIAK